MSVNLTFMPLNAILNKTQCATKQKLNRYLLWGEFKREASSVKAPTMRLATAMGPQITELFKKYADAPGTIVNKALNATSTRFSYGRTSMSKWRLSLILFNFHKAP